MSHGRAINIENVTLHDDNLKDTNIPILFFCWFVLYLFKIGTRVRMELVFMGDESPYFQKLLYPFGGKMIKSIIDKIQLICNEAFLY